MQCWSAWMPLCWFELADHGNCRVVGAVPLSRRCIRQRIQRSRRPQWRRVFMTISPLQVHVDRLGLLLKVSAKTSNPRLEKCKHQSLLVDVFENWVWKILTERNRRSVLCVSCSWQAKYSLLCWLTSRSVDVCFKHCDQTYSYFSKVGQFTSILVGLPNFRSFLLRFFSVKTRVGSSSWTKSATNISLNCCELCAIAPPVSRLQVGINVHAFLTIFIFTLQSDSLCSPTYRNSLFNANVIIFLQMSRHLSTYPFSITRTKFGRVLL